MDSGKMCKIVGEGEEGGGRREEGGGRREEGGGEKNSFCDNLQGS